MMLKHTVTLLSFTAPNTFRVFLAAGKTKMSNFRKLFWVVFFRLVSIYDYFLD